MSSIPALGAALLFVGSLDGACAQPADCVKLDDAAARLDCYDRLHGRAAGAPPPRFERPAGTSATVAAPVAPVASVAPAPRAAASRLAERWDLKGETGSLFSPRAYRPVYLLPATWTDAVNRRPGSPTPDHSVANDLELRAVESKYQSSLKAKLGQDLRGGERSRGSAQLDWVFPLSGALHGYFQAFSGQGESLVDYNHRQTKLGLGVTIAGWR